MRRGFILSGIAAVGLLAAGLIAAVPAPAYAAQNTVGVKGGAAVAFAVSCTSASTCNQITTNAVDTYFERTGSTASSLGVFYKIINGTAVDGRDFNIPATGEVVIPAGQTVTDMRIPTLYDGLYGATGLSFGVEITGTTTPITISNGSTSSLLESGNIPSDCSFTWEGGLSLALGCTGRPSNQVWYLRAGCTIFPPPTRTANGNQVTGEGTSTADCGTTVQVGLLNIVS
jgi:hypothetical protein